MTVIWLYFFHIAIDKTGNWVRWTSTLYSAPLRIQYTVIKKVVVKSLHLGILLRLVYLGDDFCRLIYLGDDICRLMYLDDEICLWYRHPGTVDQSASYRIPRRRDYCKDIFLQCPLLSTKNQTLDMNIAFSQVDPSVPDGTALLLNLPSEYRSCHPASCSG